MDSVRQTVIEFDAPAREIFKPAKPKIETRRRWVDRIQIVKHNCEHLRFMLE
jgi:hypothetical protein